MPTIALNWNVVDSGPRSGAENMEIDRRALERMQAGLDDEPNLRLFQWIEPTVTYGYLLPEADVQIWSKKFEIGNSKLEVVKRPTGGGAVYHTPSDLSISLLWPRESKMFSDRPRECYAEIHGIILDVLEKRLRHPGEGNVIPAKAVLFHNDNERVRTVEYGIQALNLHSRECLKPGSRLSPGRRNADPVGLPVCFQEPVCNDIMRDGKKIVGGALRITKRAILYQGTIQYGR